MKVVMYVTAGTALLVGVGYGFDGSDIPFFKGTEQQCREAARERRLVIDEMEKTPYHRTFKQTQFECGDVVTFISVELSDDGYRIHEPKQIEMKLNSCMGSKPRVTSGSYSVLKDAQEEIGLFQMSSRCGSQQAGHFYCGSRYPSDVTKLMANVHVWIEQETSRMLAEAHKTVNNLKMQQVKAQKELREYAQANEQLLNKIN